MKPKRVVIISDLHCGSQVGLTHPDFDSDPREGARHKLYQARRKYWKFYADALREVSPIDVLIVNGDCIDGKGEKSGGTELLTADRNEQCDMAAAAIQETKCKAIYMTFGTPFHAGASEDWEQKVATSVEAAKIGGHDWLDINGLVFDYRHHVGSSSVPHARHTAVAREHLWSVLWAEHDEYPLGNILIRSHVHYFNYSGGYGWLAMTTPALQGAGSKYGARVCSGTVDFGLISFTVTGKDDYTWRAHVARSVLKHKPIRIR